MADFTKLPDPANPWQAYMGELYQSRRPPQPLGTVKFDEIEAQAQEKLKDLPGGSLRVPWAA